MTVAGFLRPGLLRGFVAEVPLAARRVVAAGTAQDQVTLGTAALAPVGVTVESATAPGQTVTVATEGVVAVVAAGAIARLTAGSPTRVYAAADGKVSATGTMPIGWMDTASAAAAADGDVVTIRLEIDQAGS